MSVLGVYAAAPAQAMNYRSRKELARYLNTDTNNVSSEKYVQNWEGLAELMEYNYQDILNLQRSNNPTMELLEKWTMNQGSTIGQLWEILQKLEMYNIIEDETFLQSLIQDAERYSAQKLQRQRELSAAPVQVNEVHSSSVSSGIGGVDHHCDQYRNITVGEITTGRPEYFDAFVCFTYLDLAFVKQMIQMLEGVHGLKLCVDVRDLLPGTSQHTVTAKLIEERCKKMLVILSENFLTSPECDFQTKLAHSLSPGSRSKKLVPILTQMCTPPNILRHITLVDYTKYDLLEWFWIRLASSLKEPPYIDNATLLEYVELPPQHPKIHRDALEDERRRSCSSLAGTSSLLASAAAVQFSSIPGETETDSAMSTEMTEMQPLVASQSNPLMQVASQSNPTTLRGGGGGMGHSSMMTPMPGMNLPMFNPSGGSGTQQVTTEMSQPPTGMMSRMEHAALVQPSSQHHTAPQFAPPPQHPAAAAPPMPPQQPQHSMPQMPQYSAPQFMQQQQQLPPQMAMAMSQTQPIYQNIAQPMMMPQQMDPIQNAQQFNLPVFPSAASQSVPQAQAQMMMYQPPGGQQPQSVVYIMQPPPQPPEEKKEKKLKGKKKK